jgi:N-acetylglutamate synthase-like GNAT family acetyltransferase
MESEVGPIIGFLNKYLRTGMDWSIEAEYPQVFSKNNLENLRIIEDQGRVLAHAATKYLILKTHIGLLKVAAIGSVLTDPSFRNQGLSHEILESSLAAANANGADFAILWTDLYEFYRKMGFELAGREISLVIEENPDVAAGPLRLMKSNMISPEAILRLYQQHPCGSIRNVEEIRKNLQIPNSRVYSAWGSDNQLLAYAVEGKGADLKGYVHEWGGGVSALLPLLSHIRKDVGQPITVIMPSYAKNLIQQLSQWRVTINEGYLGMIRPVNFNSLFAKVTKRARQLGLADFVIEKTNEGFRVGSKGDIIQLSTINEVSQLLFGPLPEGSLKAEYQKLFPIDLWVWGWDSV